jgi:hypothetical protein
MQNFCALQHKKVFKCRISIKNYFYNILNCIFCANICHKKSFLFVYKEMFGMIKKHLSYNERLIMVFNLQQQDTKNYTNEELSPIALKTFFNITENAWKLNIEQQRILLGFDVDLTELKNNKITLSHDMLERISYILGIYKALHLIFNDDESADGWIKRPNNAALFAGKSALDRMLSGNIADLYEVRCYLDAKN